MSNEFLPENGQSSEQLNPIGSRLRQARQDRHMTVTDIARQLRLTTDRIEALENNKYEDMPGITFAKGYLRAYARLVDLPSDEIIAEFDRLHLMPETKTLSLSSYKSPISLDEKTVKRIIYFVAIGLLILVAVWRNSVVNSDSANLNTAGPSKHQPIQNAPVAGAAPPATALTLPKNTPESGSTTGQASVENAANTSTKQNEAMSSEPRPAPPASIGMGALEADSATEGNSAVEQGDTDVPVKSHKKRASHSRLKTVEQFDDDE